jgi:AraC-like DNA-binding protein
MTSMDRTEQSAASSFALDRTRLRNLSELHGSDDPVFAQEAYFPAAQQGKMHSHARGQLVCATSFAVDVVAGQRRWILQPGNAAWLPSGLGHSVSGSAPTGLFRSLYIRPDLARRLGDEAVVFGLSPLLRELLPRLVAIYEGQADRGIYPHLAALILDEIERAEPKPDVAVPSLPAPRDRRLRLICDGLVSQPADRRTLEDWGRAAGASARTLERLFREETGLSFKTWRQSCRIAAAIPRLQQGTPVQLVAWEVGYDSPSAFAAIFRRVVGTNPAGMQAGH